jgi:hypothetical protein
VTIQEFSEKHRVRARMDSCGEMVIPGKPRKGRYVENRRHIFEFDEGTFGLSYTQPVPDPASVRKYNNARSMSPNRSRPPPPSSPVCVGQRNRGRSAT